jgi:hypothetical protein
LFASIGHIVSNAKRGRQRRSAVHHIFDHAIAQFVCGEECGGALVGAQELPRERAKIAIRVSAGRIEGDARDVDRVHRLGHAALAL